MNDGSTTNALWVEVAGGKYTVIQDAKGRLTALRYGKAWRDCCGDGLIFSMASDLQELRDELAEANEWANYNHFCKGESGSGELSFLSEDVPCVCAYCKTPSRALLKERAEKAERACAWFSDYAQKLWEMRDDSWSEELLGIVAEMRNNHDNAGHDYIHRDKTKTAVSPDPDGGRA